MKCPIAKIECEGITVEVYSRKQVNTIIRNLMKEKRKAHEAVNNHDAREEENVLPTITTIVQTIQQLPDDMRHSFADLMLKTMGRKLSSTGHERAQYDAFLHLVHATHEIIEKAQNGKFEQETMDIQENGKGKRIVVFKFVKKESA